MPTPEEAVSDYDNNTSSARWSDGVSQAVSDGSYRAGIANFLGVDASQVNSDAENRWQSGVQRQSAQTAYDQNTSGQAWLDAYRRSVTQ